MAKVYRTRCIVRKDKKTYARGTIIEGLTNEEIEQGISQHWLEEVGSKEESTAPKNSKKKDGKKKPDKPAAGSKDQEPDADSEDEDDTGDDESGSDIRAKAEELEIEVTDEMTDEEIEQLIAEKEAGAR